MVYSVANSFSFSREDIKQMYVSGDENDIDDLFYWYKGAKLLSESNSG